jgi:hypothetical protein
MVAKSSAPVLGPITHFVAAALAGIITIGILASVTDLFLRDGRPMERLAAAERACVDHPYVSEREACMREWAATARPVSMAGK